RIFRACPLAWTAQECAEITFLAEIAVIVDIAQSRPLRGSAGDGDHISSVYDRDVVLKLVRHPGSRATAIAVYKAHLRSGLWQMLLRVLRLAPLPIQIDAPSEIFRHRKWMRWMSEGSLARQYFGPDCRK